MKLVKDNKVLRIYADSGTRYCYVGIAAAVPTAHICRVKCLGLKNFLVPAEAHPAYSRPTNYAWNLLSGEMYGVLLAVELAAVYAIPGQQIRVFTDWRDS